jgi:DNA-binding NarL/FixJ family response regulator
MNPHKNMLYDILDMHERGLTDQQIARKLRLKRSVVTQAIKEWL